MAEKIVLQQLTCPTCGSQVKYEENDSVAVCMACGNEYHPSTVSSTPKESQEGFAPGNSVQTIRVEGISSASSALAFIDEYFEDYDLKSYSISKEFEIREIKKVLNKLRSSYADDKNTWIVTFNVKHKCFALKIEGCYGLLREIIDDYDGIKDDVYIKFDLYKLLAHSLKESYGEFTQELNKYIGKAQKYGAEESEIEELRDKLSELRSAEHIKEFEDIRDIPAVKKRIERIDTEISARLAQKGINADAEYENALSLIKAGSYTEALDSMITLEGYKESRRWITRIDRYFLLDDVVQIVNALYSFRSNGEGGYSLFECNNGMIKSAPIIENIYYVICNYSSKLYYLDSNGYLCYFDFKLRIGKRLSDESFEHTSYSHPNAKCRFLLTKSLGYTDKDSKLFVLDMSSSMLNLYLDKIVSIKYKKGNIFVLKQTVKTDKNISVVERAIDVENSRSCVFELGDITVRDIHNDCLIYTVEEPDAYNLSLYSKKLWDDSPESLIESNILEFSDILDDKYYFFIGSKCKKTLINIDINTHERNQMPPYIEKIIEKRGEWFYYIRRAGRNTALCRSHIDGSDYSLISNDIDSFVAFKNGYLYYLNEYSSLARIRMDGSNYKRIAGNVDSVLSVSESKIIFVSYDIIGKRSVKSIYAVDNDNGGLIKLAYDIKTAKNFDENYIYFINSRVEAAVGIILPDAEDTDQNSQFDFQTEGSGEDQPKFVDTLFRLNKKTNKIEKLLKLELETDDTDNLKTLFIVLLIIFAFLGFIGFCVGAPGVGFFNLIGVIAMAIVLYMRKNKKE